MVKNSEKLRRWEASESALERNDFHRNLGIYEALYREAVALGALPALETPEHWEEKKRFVRMLHVLKAAG